MRKLPSALILADAHVHLHACFDLCSFLDGAYANFAHAAQHHAAGRPFAGVLFLTEGLQESGFSRFLALLEKQHAAGAEDDGAWRVHTTGEDSAVYLTGKDQKTLLVVAGCQILTREKLEVLALGTRRPFEEGLPIDRLICDVAGTGALPVVPWGFGKWTGNRGKRVAQLLQDDRLPRFFLGDNANRFDFGNASRLFCLAKEKNIQNLPGSDPLPFPSEAQRAGRAGFILPGSLDAAHPVRDLKQQLLGLQHLVRHFGSGETGFRFMRNQLRMQYRKRIR